MVEGYYANYNLIPLNPNAPRRTPLHSGLVKQPNSSFLRGEIDKNDIIATTATHAQPATIYAGVGPVSAYNFREVQEHLADTSVPAFSQLMGTRQTRDGKHCVECNQALPDGRQSVKHAQAHQRLQTIMNDGVMF